MIILFQHKMLLFTFGFQVIAASGLNTRGDTFSVNKIYEVCLGVSFIGVLKCCVLIHETARCCCVGTVFCYTVVVRIAMTH